MRNRRNFRLSTGRPNVYWLPRRGVARFNGRSRKVGSCEFEIGRRRPKSVVQDAAGGWQFRHSVMKYQREYGGRTRECPPYHHLPLTRPGLARPFFWAHANQVAATKSPLLQHISGGQILILKEDCRCGKVHAPARRMLRARWSRVKGSSLEAGARAKATPGRGKQPGRLSLQPSRMQPGILLSPIDAVSQFNCCGDRKH
jgi:hypothetical protein